MESALALNMGTGKAICSNKNSIRSPQARLKRLLLVWRVRGVHPQHMAKAESCSELHIL